MMLAEQIELACLMEATARKPGNVHPAAAFRDLCFDDFVKAARTIGKPLAAVSETGLGAAIFQAVRDTRIATGTNVNLGIVLLMAPLAAVPDGVSLVAGIGTILERTTVEDAEKVFAAIRLASPGGIGEAKSQDVHSLPTVNLRDAMALAADRDRIAEQYVTDFALVFKAREKFCKLLESSLDWESAIVFLHVWMMSKWTDTLIARKCGQEMAKQARHHAVTLLESAGTDGRLDRDQLHRFDEWLRADGHRRNPGSTADLIAATLFAALRDGLIQAPSREEVEEHAVRIQSES